MTTARWRIVAEETENCVEHGKVGGKVMSNTSGCAQFPAADWSNG